jgi:hypothetical protein
MHDIHPTTQQSESADATSAPDHERKVMNDFGPWDD